METKQLPQNPSEITVSETVAASKSSSVPSPNSSPSHEFSFTISLHSAQITAPSSPTLLSSKNKQQQQQQLEAIDLSPADDIFFHGHLLPLHFLSHVHASPRTSTATSLDNYYPQTRDEKFVNQYNINNNNNNFTEDNHEFIEVNDNNNNNNNNNTCHIPKPKSFSLSGFTKDKSERIKKLKFDVGQFLKRYIKMVKPLLSSKERREQKQQQQQEERDNEQRKCQSFSGSLTPKIHRRELRDLRGEFSAPVSMRTSPTNSGLLVAKAGVSSPALATSGSSVSSVVSVSESSMDELHAAIQSAIAHCKNSASSQFNSSSSSSSSPPLRVS